MCVDRELSEQTAGRIRGPRVWLPDEYDHKGLNADGARISSTA